MQTLTQQLIDAGLANRVITEGQLARILSGSPQRRYNLVNRALKTGELQQLKRGRYLLDARLRNYPAHPFALAQAYVPGSYISFETALAHHGWIPEAVYTNASVTPRSKTLKFETSTFGYFSFLPLAIEPGYFLEMVVRTEFRQQSALVAAPARALMDLVCSRRVEWKGMGWLTSGLRIDPENLSSITREHIRTLLVTYKQKRMKSFITALSIELGHD
jgi:hypothetical protein